MPTRNWLEKIRKEYDMPFLKRYMRVSIDGMPGVLLGGNRMMKIRVKVATGKIVIAHPMYHIVYYHHNGEIIAKYA